MRELQEIIRRVSQFEENERAILATVVEVIGSGYRRAGARMLIDENGYSIGTVSGGCLEADVLERAVKVLETGEPTVITYDTTRDENSVFGLGMGCRGVIRVLLEPIKKESEVIKFVSECYEKRENYRITTLIQSSNPNLRIGSRLFQNEMRFYTTDFSADEILEINDLFENSSLVETLSFGEVFIETINPPLSLILFGAGFDALPVVRFAKELGWRVTVVDHRAAFANTERLPEAAEIIVSRSEDLPEGLFKDENSVAVVMTHNYERDREILFRLLNSECRYIGVLGPKLRTENLIRELEEAERKFNKWNLEKLHTPIGLDIGSETPEEIALAVVAEIKTVLSKRTGGFLRCKKGSINNQPVNPSS